MTPREKAEACFAKARSTTSEHERDNAVTVGIKVAEKAGLDLDTFDIPGRERKARTHYVGEIYSRTREPGSARSSADNPFSWWPTPDYTSESIRETMAAFHRREAEELARQRADHERKRAEERERRASDRYAELIDTLGNALWAAGWRVYRAADDPRGRRRWHVTNPSGATFDEVDDLRLCRIAEESGSVPMAGPVARAYAEELEDDL